MNKILDKFRFNLQLFTEGKDGVDDENTNNGTDDNLDNNLNDEDNDEEDDEEDDEELDNKKETVPLAVFLAEKAKNKANKERLRVLEESQMDSEIVAKKEVLKAKLVKAGYQEELAEILAEDKADTLGVVSRTRKAKNADEVFKEDLADLVVNPMYSDAKAYSEDIKNVMAKYKDMPIEDAYTIVRGRSGSKMKELETTVEQRQATKRSKGASKKVADASSKSNKKKAKLSELDKKAFEGLKQMQPDKKWTVEKYLKNRERQ